LGEALPEGKRAGELRIALLGDRLSADDRSREEENGPENIMKERRGEGGGRGGKSQKNLTFIF